jgi:hypothetical protein
LRMTHFMGTTLFAPIPKVSVIVFHPGTPNALLGHARLHTPQHNVALLACSLFRDILNVHCGVYSSTMAEGSSQFPDTDPPMA